MSIKRYGIRLDPYLVAPFVYEQEDGTLVSYDDHKAALTKARAETIEECVRVCRLTGPEMEQVYGHSAECVSTADECARRILALKENNNG